MNKKEEKFSLIKRIRSFGFAWNGLKIFFKEEHNARIHLTASIIIIILGFYYKISNTEWLVILMTIGFVMTMEIINSVIERVCDLISIERNEHIKMIKDMAASAVLLSSMIAAAEGLIIFLPKIFK